MNRGDREFVDRILQRFFAEEERERVGGGEEEEEESLGTGLFRVTSDRNIV